MFTHVMLFITGGILTFSVILIYIDVEFEWPYWSVANNVTLCQPRDSVDMLKLGCVLIMLPSSVHIHENVLALHLSVDIAVPVKVRGSPTSHWVPFAGAIIDAMG